MYVPDLSAPRTERQVLVALSLGHSQILSRNCEKKLGEGLGTLQRHKPEMVDLVHTNRVYHFRSVM